MKPKALPFSRNLNRLSLGLDFLRAVILHLASIIPPRTNFLLPLLLFSTLSAFGAGSTGSVTITGTAEVGQTLSAGNNLADADGLGTITYQWYRDGIPIKNTLKDGVNGVDGLDGAYNVTLSADGKHAYVTGETEDALSWYKRNASTGALAYGGMLKDGVNGVDGLNGARGVTLSADGKHAYVTGNADHAVSWYERNASTGALTYGGMLKDGLGWLWTDDGVYPFLYGAGGKDWLYFFGEHEGTRLFYNYGKREWKTLE